MSSSSNVNAITTHQDMKNASMKSSEPIILDISLKFTILEECRLLEEFLDGA